MQKPHGHDVALRLQLPYLRTGVSGADSLEAAGLHIRPHEFALLIKFLASSHDTCCEESGRLTAKVEP